MKRGVPTGTPLFCGHILGTEEDGYEKGPVGNGRWCMCVGAGTGDTDCGSISGRYINVYRCFFIGCMRLCMFEKVKRRETGANCRMESAENAARYPGNSVWNQRIREGILSYIGMTRTNV